ncbi:MAG: TonB-dependent receptor [Rhodothermales bacterium]|nr:TonB-dependent receptor [Rhodothermales bacterium]
MHFTVIQPADAQFATVRGLIVDASDEQPIHGANVALRSEDGQLTGTSSQAGGLYVLSRIMPGTYSITISFVGYISHVDTITVDFAQQLTVNASLEFDEAQMGDVVVESERRETQQRSIAGFVTIRPNDLERVPQPGLSADLVSYLNASPGFQTAGDRGGQIFVRGGTPIQNLFLLDGMRVYQPVHIVGLYSAFPSEIISYSDIYAGGYGARYGGRLAGVIDVTTRNGNKKRPAGSVTVAPFLGAARVEFPLVKDKVSVVASGRESLIRDVAPNLIDESLPFRFGDRFVKMHAFLNQTSHMSVTALKTFDEGDLAGNSQISRNIRWSNEAYGGRFHYLAPTLPVLAQITISISRFDIERLVDQEVVQNSKSSGFEGQFNFAYLLGDSEIHFGIFGHSSRFSYGLTTSTLDDREEFITQGGAFIDGIARMKRLELNPGFRFHSFPSRGQLFMEPRLRMRYRPASMPDYSFSAAWGIFHQQIVALSDDRTVSDVFSAWSPSPQQRPVPRSAHYIAGFGGKPLPWFDFSVEGFMLQAKHLIIPQLGEPLTLSTQFIPVRSDSKGIDFKAVVSRSRYFATSTYSVSRVEYTSATQTFNPPQDRRHQFYFSLGSSFRDFKFAFQWQYGSGLPYTPIRGFINQIEVTERSYDFVDDDGSRAIVYAESFSERQPAFHRMDVTAEKAFRLWQSELTVQLGALNIYNRSNIFDYDYFSLTRINQLPFIPSLGIRLRTL